MATLKVQFPHSAEIRTETLPIIRIASSPDPPPCRLRSHTFEECGSRLPPPCQFLKMNASSRPLGQGAINIRSPGGVSPGMCTAFNSSSHGFHRLDTDWKQSLESVQKANKSDDMQRIPYPALLCTVSADVVATARNRRGNFLMFCPAARQVCPTTGHLGPFSGLHY